MDARVRKNEIIRCEWTSDLHYNPTPYCDVARASRKIVTAYVLSACADWKGSPEMSGRIESFSRRATVKIKLGIKAFSIVSSMVLSLVVISGCNDEAPAPTTKPSTGTPEVKTPATTCPRRQARKTRRPLDRSYDLSMRRSEDSSPRLESMTAILQGSIQMPTGRVLDHPRTRPVRVDTIMSSSP